jgi:diguanylate cyclase (GGDEF)-like protein
VSLRAQLLGLVLAATLLPAALLGWRFSWENNAAIESAVKTLVTAADNIAADLDHRVQGTAQLHHGLAHARLLGDADRRACSAFLAGVLEAYPQYTGLLTVLPSGQLHCDSLQTGRQLDLRDRAYVQRSLAGEKGLLIEPVFGRLTGNSVLQIVLPVRAGDAGQGDALRFMLVASLNLQMFARESQQKSLLTAAELLLVDSKGTVMAWVGGPAGAAVPGTVVADSAVFGLVRDIKPGAGGTRELTGADGQPQVWALAASPALGAAGLHILVGQPRATLLAVPKQRLRQGFAVLAGAALLLFAGIGWLVQRGIRRPVLRLTAMAQALGAGQLDARIEPPHPRGEIGGLMQVFNRTAAALQQQRQDIDALGQQLRDAHLREISERHQNEQRLSRMANYDSLTGLPNRSLFHDRLQVALARAQRSGRPFALMILDIDRFKHINDSLGHDVGDGLLLSVAQVLTTCVRGTDSVGHDSAAPDGVFRLGGDEFTVLVEDLADSGDATVVAERILQALRKPFAVREHELFTSVSIGITVFAHDGTGLDALIKQADMAMYRAKELGRDAYSFFDEQLNAAAHRRQQFEARLRHALERNEFLLHFQAKADLASGRVTGVEALLRWQAPGQGLVGPDQFVPILEETGLIGPVGAWVLQEACAQMQRWQAAGMRPIQLAVNLSARQFRHQDLVGQVQQVLAQTGLHASRLEVELTESLLIDDSDQVRNILAGLTALGVRIAIDDFGAGQSSLRYLKRLKVHTLKIDRSFVMDTPDDPDDSAITAAVIALGHSLGLKVVAEGVETPAQLEFLRSHGCDELQGYLLSRPIAATAFADWMAVHDNTAPALAG